MIPATRKFRAEDEIELPAIPKCNQNAGSHVSFPDAEVVGQVAAALAHAEGISSWSSV
jgi:hypothetical protein